MPTLTVDVPPSLADFVEAAVAQGEYGSEAELVRDALRRLRQDAEWRAQRASALRAALDEGFADVAAGHVSILDMREIRRAAGLSATPAG